MSDNFKQKINSLRLKKFRKYRNYVFMILPWKALTQDPSSIIAGQSACLPALTTRTSYSFTE
jgi:hypothetical protein